jgi:hypothetical protein
MPFKSKAQRRKFAELLVKGEISPEVYEEWNRETGRKELPERVKSKGKRKPARRKGKRSATRPKALARKGKERATRKPSMRRKKAKPRRAATRQARRK